MTHAHSAAAAVSGGSRRVSAAGAGDTKATLAVLFILAAGALLPSAIFFILHTSSLAAGLVGGSLMIIAALFLGLGKRVTGVKLIDAGTWAVVIGMAIGVHVAIASFVFEPDSVRTAASLIAFLLVTFTALAMDDTLYGQGDAATDRATNILRAGYLGLAVLGFLGIQPPSEFVQPIFPFTEPSHFALAFLPLLISGCVRTKGWRRYALLATGLVVAYMLKSLSLVVGCALVAAVCLSSIRIVLGFVVALVVVSYLDVTYFSDRLNFSSDTDNLSTLVFLEGWEFVQDSFRRSDGWGIGFQQLGYAPIISPSADRIFMIFHTDYNIQDGGFTASKVMSEFGVLGIAFLLAYLAAFARIGLFLRACAAGARPASAGEVLAASYVCGLSIDLFVRGNGYFSGTALFAVSGFAYLVRRHIATLRAILPGRGVRAH
jgi:uncharacterized membrane protein